MKIAVVCLNLTMNAYIKWRALVEFPPDFRWPSSSSFSDKTQPPLDILPTCVNLATNVLSPEYVSIYVKYCYLDTLVLLIQTFLEWTPGMFLVDRTIRTNCFSDIEQQQYELTRYASVQTSLLDFIDYCNEIIDIHPSNTPQYKCAVKVSARSFYSHSILRHSSLWFTPSISYRFSSPEKNHAIYPLIYNRKKQWPISSICFTK